MGIYIKGMEMPRSCEKCKFTRPISVFDFASLCVFTRNTCVGHGRNEDCPLAEVPEPHGRLIDADRCIDYIRNNNQHAWEALAYAPTVIESEVEE